MLREPQQDTPARHTEHFGFTQYKLRRSAKGSMTQTTQMELQLV